MKIGVATGHSHRTNITERRFEFTVCRKVDRHLQYLLASADYDVVDIPDRIYMDSTNDEALRFKTRHFNENAVELAVELHLNAGGGKYSTCIYWDNGARISEVGLAVSASICAQWATAFQWPTIGAMPQSYFQRDLWFLNKSNAPAIIPEPAFKDNPEQRAYMETEAFAAQYAATVFTGIEIWRYELR